MLSLRRRRAAVLLSLCSLFLTGLLVPATTASAALPAGASSFVAVPHLRLADTRSGYAFGFTRLDATTIRVSLKRNPAVVPAGTLSVVLNVTALNSAAPGGLVAWPTGEPMPATAHIILTAKGQSRTNMITVRLGTGSSVTLKTSTGMAALVDLVGAYVAVDPATTAVSGGRFRPLAGAHRALNSVAVAVGGSALADLATVGVPAHATAAVVSISTEAGNRGAWTAYADRTPRPAVIDLFLDAAAQRRSNLTIVPLNGTDSKVRVFAGAGGKVSLDVVGYYTGETDVASTDGLYIAANAATPYRRLDTPSRWKLAPIGPTVLEFGSGTPFVVQGLVANLRTRDSWDAGVIISRPAGAAGSAMPVARLTRTREAFSVAFYARTSTRGVALTLSRGAHVTVDVAGWFIGPRPAWTLAVPKINLLSATPAVKVRWRDAAGLHVAGVQASTSNSTYDMTRIADLGLASAFNGMSTLGKAGNTMLFGHRTTHGGMFRYLHTIPIGATFSIQGGNGKWYNYRVTARNVTLPVFTTINNLSKWYPPVTAQLIACSRADGTPTSTSYRLTVTGILVSVTAS